MEAAARARLDADYACMSTAPGRRREVVRTRTEAAACARLDVDYACMSTAPSKRREVSGTGTWTCTWARSSAGPYKDCPRTRPPAPPSPPSPPFISLSSFPLHSHPPHAHSLTSRGMMMGLQVKGHLLKKVHQLPVAKGTGATVAAAPTWRRTLPASSGIASQLKLPRRTVTHRGRVYLVGGDTIEDVARTLVLAPPDPTNNPLLCSTPPSPFPST